MRKVLSFMLVLVMLLTQLALPSFADESYDEWVDPYEGLEVVDMEVEILAPFIFECDGYRDECMCGDHDDFYVYDVYGWQLVYTVTYENGETETGSAYELSGDVYIEDNQYDEHWDKGEHSVYAFYRNFELAFTVDVVESPVASVTAVATKPLVEGWDGTLDCYYDENDEEIWFYDYYVYDAEPVFTVTFKDGTTVTGTDEELYEQTNYWTYYEYDQYENPWEVGKNTVKMTYMGYEFEVEVELLANPYKDVTISGENELVLKFHGVNDEDTFETKVVDCYGFFFYPEDNSFSCILVTEDGQEYDAVLYCDVDEDGNVFLNKNISFDIGSFRTNTLETNNFIIARLSAEDILYYSLSYRAVSEDLTGVLFEHYNADEEISVDDVVAISTYVCEMFPSDEDEYYYYHTVDLDTAEANIESVFGLTDVDVKSSSFYKPLWQKIVLEEPVDNGMYYETKSFAFADGKWTYVADVYDYFSDEKTGEMTVVLKEDGTVYSIDFTEVAIELGDANGDGEVTAMDARLILQYVAALVTEEDLYAYYADVNGDGEITAVDARMVLQKVAGLIE